MALKLFAGKGQTRGYPSTAQLLRFGRVVCRVDRPALVLQRIAQAMEVTLDQAARDPRVPTPTLDAMREVWQRGLAYAKEARRPGD